MSGIDEQDRRRRSDSRPNLWLHHGPSNGGRVSPIDLSIRERRERRRVDDANRKEWGEKHRSRVKHRQRVRDILFALVICVGLIPVILGTYTLITPSDYDTYDSYVYATGTFDRIEIYQNDASGNELIFLADVYDNGTVTFAKIIEPDEIVRIFFEITIGYKTTIKETIMAGGETESINLLDDVYVTITLAHPVVKSASYVEWTVCGWGVLGTIFIIVMGVLCVQRVTYDWLRNARYSYYQGTRWE